MSGSVPGAASSAATARAAAAAAAAPAAAAAAANAATAAAAAAANAAGAGEQTDVPEALQHEWSMLHDLTRVTESLVRDTQQLCDKLENGIEAPYAVGEARRDLLRMRRHVEQLQQEANSLGIAHLSVSTASLDPSVIKPTFEGECSNLKSQISQWNDSIAVANRGLRANLASATEDQASGALGATLVSTKPEVA